MRVAVFCEARADFSIAAGLVQRALGEEGPSWVREHLEAFPLDHLLTWVGAGEDGYFKIHHLRDEIARRKILPPRNRFDGKRGGPDALSAYTASLIARDEARRSGTIDAILFVRDMDDQGEARRQGLDEGRRAAGVQMILACPDPMREAWLLAGFEPGSTREHDVLHEETKSLGFDPRKEAHRLRDKKESDPRSPKRLARTLTAGDRERESRCWMATPLAILRERGEENGLSAYLLEIEERLFPLFLRG